MHCVYHPDLVCLLFVPSLYSNLKNFSFTCIIISASCLRGHALQLNFDVVKEELRKDE